MIFDIIKIIFEFSDDITQAKISVTSKLYYNLYYSRFDFSNQNDFIEASKIDNPKLFSMFIFDYHNIYSLSLLKDKPNITKHIISNKIKVEFNFPEYFYELNYETMNYLYDNYPLDTMKSLNTRSLNTEFNILLNKDVNFTHLMIIIQQSLYNDPNYNIIPYYFNCITKKEDRIKYVKILCNEYHIIDHVIELVLRNYSQLEQLDTSYFQQLYNKNSQLFMRYVIYYDIIKLFTTFSTSYFSDFMTSLKMYHKNQIFEYLINNSKGKIEEVFEIITNLSEKQFLLCFQSNSATFISENFEKIKEIKNNKFKHLIKIKSLDNHSKSLLCELYFSKVRETNYKFIVELCEEQCITPKDIVELCLKYNKKILLRNVMMNNVAICDYMINKN
jgi:hypothetical protein